MMFGNLKLQKSREFSVQIQICFVFVWPVVLELPRELLCDIAIENQFPLCSFFSTDYGKVSSTGWV